MPTYRVTTGNGEGSERFEETLEFADDKAAIEDAQVALADMAHDQLPDGERLSLSVQVATEAGQIIYRAGLDFERKEGGSSGDQDPQTSNEAKAAKLIPSRD